MVTNYIYAKNHPYDCKYDTLINDMSMKNMIECDRS